MQLMRSMTTTVFLCSLVIGTSAAIIFREGDLTAKAFTAGILIILAAALILGRKNWHKPEDDTERKRRQGKWRVFDNAVLVFLLIMNLAWVLGR